MPLRHTAADTRHGYYAMPFFIAARCFSQPPALTLLIRYATTTMPLRHFRYYAPRHYAIIYVTVFRLPGFRHFAAAVFRFRQRHFSFRDTPRQMVRRMH